MKRLLCSSFLAVAVCSLGLTSCATSGHFAHEYTRRNEVCPVKALPTVVHPHDEEFETLTSCDEGVGKYQVLWHQNPNSDEVRIAVQLFNETSCRMHLDVQADVSPHSLLSTGRDYVSTQVNPHAGETVDIGLFATDSYGNRPRLTIKVTGKLDHCR